MSEQRPELQLANYPDEQLNFVGDEVAVALLKALGVFEKLQPDPANKGALPWALRLDIRDHPTHWITATHFGGLPRLEDNGYAVRCVPKSKVTRIEFERDVAQETSEMFPEGKIVRVGNQSPTGTN